MSAHTGKRHRPGNRRLLLPAITLGVVLALTMVAVLAAVLIRRQPVTENTQDTAEALLSEETPGGIVDAWDGAETDGTGAVSQDAGVIPDAAGEPPEDDRAESIGLDAALETEVRSILSRMTTEEKIAQLFFVTPECLSGEGLVTSTGDLVRGGFRAHPVGGVIFLPDNLIKEEQTKRMLDDLQDYATKTAGFLVFFGVDEESGRVARIAGKEGFLLARSESAEILGTQGSEAVADTAEAIGSYLHKLGFNVDFAPDADVLTNPQNEVIGDRSFGSDPARVAELSGIFADGLKSNGVLPCFKHFPGHGGTKEDTHKETAYSYMSKEALMSTELIPFIEAIENGAEMIMVSHVSLPNVTGDDTPASLSEKIVADLLRGELRFDGIIITDSLGMGAVSKKYTPGEAAVRALQAGCDMLLLNDHLEEAQQGVQDALRDGTLTETRIEASVSRILRQKLKMQGESGSREVPQDIVSTSGDGRTLSFVDAFGERHTADINPEVAKNEYNPEGFVREANDRVRYEGENFASRTGIDLAHHQGAVDWQAVHEDGIEFAFIRLGFRGYGQEGNIRLDERFEENVNNARQAGIQVGVYFFSQAVNEEEAAEEASFVIEHLQGHPIDLEVVFDPENILDAPARTDHVSGEQFTKNAQRFCSMIEQAGYRPMIYSNMMWEAYQFDMKSLENYPFWYADYEKLPQTPYRFKYWQYSESGTVRGVKGPVDLDIEFLSW